MLSRIRKSIVSATLFGILFGAGAYASLPAKKDVESIKRAESLREYETFAHAILPSEDFLETLERVSFERDGKENGNDTTASSPTGDDAVVSSRMPLPSAVSSSPIQDSAALFLSFEDQYPEYYIAALADWQNEVLAHSSYIDPEKPFLFDSESDIIAFIDIFISYQKDIGVLPQEDAEAARRNLHETFLPAKRAERRNALFSKLFAVFMPEPVQAQFGIGSLFSAFGGGAAWVSAGPLCYKNTGPAAPGTLLFSPTCNAGTKLVPGTPPVIVPVADCGPFGALCTVPLGCLNAVCIRHPNSIYNRATSHCGCG